MIKKALKKYQISPERTKKNRLKKAKCGNWLILEQNPANDSTFAKFARAGVKVQHILCDKKYYGFVLNGQIYLNPSFVVDFMGTYSDVTDYYKDITSIYKQYKPEYANIGGVKVKYIKQKNINSAVFVHFKGTRTHLGLNKDWVDNFINKSTA